MSDRFTSNNNAVKVPDYFRWDAMVAYQQPKYDVQLNVFNLTNRLNYDALIPSDRGRSVPGTDLQALLLAHLQVLLSARPACCCALPNVLDADAGARCCARGSTRAGDAWVDGRATAGHQGAQVKHNLQIAEDSPVARELGADASSARSSAIRCS